MTRKPLYKTKADLTVEFKDGISICCPEGSEVYKNEKDPFHEIYTPRTNGQTGFIVKVSNDVINKRMDDLEQLEFKPVEPEDDKIVSHKTDTVVKDVGA